MKRAIGFCALFLFLSWNVGCATAPKTSGERQALIDDANVSLKRMRAADPSLDRFLGRAWGYALFPGVGKGGFIAGGAYGRGVVFERGQMLGFSDLTQATLGLQAGGQSFSELIVFETRTDLNRFTAGKLSFAANLSAVALKSGAAETTRYNDGVAVFVKPIGGLMFEAAVGGQQFTFVPR